MRSLLTPGLRWAALALTVVAFTCCARHETRVEAGNRNGVLHWGNGSDPESLDPAIGTAAVESTIMSALFEGLINIAIDGKTILPGVAERWDISDDKLVYTFHLRSDARWSDGTPVTADDFEYAFKRAADPTIGCQLVDMGYAIAGVRDHSSGKNPSPDSVGARALDPHTFELRLTHPAPYILFVLGQNPWLPVPKAVVERFGGTRDRGSAWSKPGNMVSNGAYALKSWQPDANVTVSRNPFYWDRAHVRLNEIRFYPTDNPDTEELGFRSGQFHLTFRVPLSKIAGYKAGATGALQVSPQLATWFLVFNTKRAPFDSAKVRQAFALAVNREVLVPRVLQETGTPAHSMARPGMGGIIPPVMPDYDPDLARSLLAEAGYPGGAGLPKLEFQVRSSGTDSLVGEALQQIWQKELGVRVEVAQSEPKVAISSFYSHNFQFGMTGWFPGIDSPEFILTLARGDSPANMSDWKDPEFDRAFTTAEYARSREVYEEAMHTMEHRIHDDVPYSPIYYFNQCQLMRRSLHGWRGNLLQQVDWRELWLDGTP
jgi:oligopeptide transport system substrate-binding protein